LEFFLECSGGDDHHNTPDDDDPGNPDPDADPLEDDVDRDLEDQVSDKENTGEEPEDLGRDAQRAVHLKRSVPEVDAVEECDDIDEEEERKQATAHLADGPFCDSIRM